MPKEEMEGTTSPRGLRNKHYVKPFRVHDDDDGDGGGEIVVCQKSEIALCLYTCCSEIHT